jgi:hypothetical protein
MSLNARTSQSRSQTTQKPHQNQTDRSACGRFGARSSRRPKKHKKAYAPRQLVEAPINCSQLRSHSSRTNHDLAPGGTLMNQLNPKQTKASTSAKSGGPRVY